MMLKLHAKIKNKEGSLTYKDGPMYGTTDRGDYQGPLQINVGSKIEKKEKQTNNFLLKPNTLIITMKLIKFEVLFIIRSSLIVI